MHKEFIFQMFALNTKPITMDIISVSLPVSNGTITILQGHTPLITALEMGIVSIQQQTKNKNFFAIMGGLAQITKDRVVIYTNAYEEGSKVPKDETEFNEWNKEITYEKKKDEERIRFHLINTINKWRETHRKGRILSP